MVGQSADDADLRARGRKRGMAAWRQI
jgi:hypothetical protein